MLSEYIHIHIVSSFVGPYMSRNVYVTRVLSEYIAHVPYSTRAIHPVKYGTTFNRMWNIKCAILVGFVFLCSPKRIYHLPKMRIK